MCATMALSVFKISFVIYFESKAREDMNIYFKT